MDLLVKIEDTAQRFSITPIFLSMPFIKKDWFHDGNNCFLCAFFCQGRVVIISPVPRSTYYQNTFSHGLNLTLAPICFIIISILDPHALVHLKNDAHRITSYCYTLQLLIMKNANKHIQNTFLINGFVVYNNYSIKEFWIHPFSTTASLYKLYFSEQFNYIRLNQKIPSQLLNELMKGITNKMTYAYT